MKKILLSVLTVLLLVLGFTIVMNGMNLLGIEIIGITRNPRKKFGFR